MKRQNDLNFTKGFAGDVVGPIAIDTAIRRAVAFCSSRRSGFVGYDLAGDVARRTGRLDDVGPWTILLADALAGRVTVSDVDSFAYQVEEFAELVGRIPDKDLPLMTGDELESVIHFCSFGFKGVWPPKITKVEAAIRNRAIPVLDGYMALAFGYSRESFSEGVEQRHLAIRRVVTALASRIAQMDSSITYVRRRVEEVVPAAGVLSDLRLADIILWTAQDDRMERPGKPRDAWVTATPGVPPSLAEVRWVASG